MLKSKRKVKMYESHLRYRDDIVEISRVTVIFHNMLLRMVDDRDVVDIESGEVGNIE